MNFTASNSNKTWTDSYTVTNGKNTSYATICVLGSQMGKDANARKKYFVNLLNSHPEGVVLYTKRALGKTEHAILVSDYTRTSNGGYQFYAYDSANAGDNAHKRVRFEDTTLYTKKR